MTSPQTLLMLASAIIAIALGGAHLFYTFVAPKLVPRDAALLEDMRAASLLITSETTMWKAWIGFNVSHSLCLLLFGAVFAHLAIAYPRVLETSVFLQALGILTLAAFVILSRKYWFSVPLAGTSLALLCFVGSVVASRHS